LITQLVGKLDATAVLTILLCTVGCLQSGGSKADIKAAAGKPANNSECIVCHMDFAEELISKAHEKAGIACTACHGPSLAHGDDEYNITPPDMLFGRAEITGFCRKCHPTHRKGAAYEAFVAEWLGRRRPNGRMILQDSVCTDCHGEHAVLRPDQM